LTLGEKAWDRAGQCRNGASVNLHGRFAMASSKGKSAKGPQKKLSVKKQSIKDLDASKGKDVKGGASMLRRRDE
jgi:hypothetical protein